MPTYEYRCDKYGHEFDVVQGITEDPVPTCPTCGSPVKRLISKNVGIAFKGTGFYINDGAGKGSSPSTSSNK